LKEENASENWLRAARSLAGLRRLDGGDAAYLEQTADGALCTIRHAAETGRLEERCRRCSATWKPGWSKCGLSTGRR
jgi:hypothetical protein